MRLSGQFWVFIFFYEKHQDAKQMTFAVLEVFMSTKTCCLCCFCLLVFVLLVGFGLIYVFVCSRFFRKKK